MKFGVCQEPRFAPALAVAGFDYIEVNVQSHLMPSAPESDFAPMADILKSLPIPPYAANCFLPGNLKVTGPNVDWHAVQKYVGVAMARAERVGMQIIVFGSGGARGVPDGFSFDEATSQLAQFGQIAGSIAAEHGVTVVIEPLNRGECNILTSVPEGASLAKKVNLPRFQLLVDAYHWARENEPVSNITDHGALIKHAHLATYPTRKAPGLEETDFTPFYKALKSINYSGGLSIEGGWGDIEKDAPAALARMKSDAKTAGII